MTSIHTSIVLQSRLYRGATYPSKSEIPGLESGLDDIEESGELRSIELIEGTNLRKDDDLVGGIVGTNSFENLT